MYVLVWKDQISVPTMHVIRRRSQWLHLNVVLSIVSNVFFGSMMWPSASMCWVLGVLLPHKMVLQYSDLKTLSLENEVIQI